MMTKRILLYTIKKHRNTEIPADAWSAAFYFKRKYNLH